MKRSCQKTKRTQSTRRPGSIHPRSGFTLLELILALTLTVVVSALIGGLVQLFLLNETRGRESVRQAQMARSILNMIAEDIRTSVRHYPYDTSGLQQMLSGAAGGMLGGGGAAGGMGGAAGGAIGGATGGGSSGPPSPGTGGGNAGGVSTGSAGGAPSAGSVSGNGASGNRNTSGGGGAGGASLGGGMSVNGLSGQGMGMAGGSASGSIAAGGATDAAPAPLPPGVYGAMSSIEIDVSRMPRPDEYVIQPGDLSRGTLGDMPSDIKTVSYYVQAPNSNGVLDPLSGLSSQIANGSATATAAASGGLVRRSLDRAVTQYAYAMGQSDQLIRTGEIIAPEILAIEFQYFKAASGWQSEWDSSAMGLPDVIKVTIAMQSESMAKKNPLSPGISITSINSNMIQEFGIALYSTNVIIPGANLLSAPAPSDGSGTSSNGMSSLGL